MTYPGTYAKKDPNKPAVTLYQGKSLTFKQLEEYSIKTANYLRSRGVGEGDVIAVLMENRPEYFICTWAGQRSGLYYCCISWRLVPEEVAYILSDAAPKFLFVSASTLQTAREALKLASSSPEVICLDEVEGEKHLFSEIGPMPAEPTYEEKEGMDLLYSSGTTGRPKGVKLPLPLTPLGAAAPVSLLLGGMYGMTENGSYLSPAPLYHAAPLRFSMGALRLGAHVVVMAKFDPVDFLRAIEQYRITHTQVVPTMFVRLLKLDEKVRKSFDISSLRCVIHASAPCPVEVKKAIIDWLGPIVYEYYAGTEGNGFVCCNSEEWLKHPGTVGKPLLGKVHILDENFQELPPYQDGVVYFESDSRFEYLHDPEKTKASRSPQGYTTLGDIGHLDEEGYLYLTDRKHYMIISGGVNIYPQEIENVLINHPKVLDAAVFGVPDEEMGEKVAAVIQPLKMPEDEEALKEEIEQYLREHLASYKRPRIIEFRSELPREPTGKLLKRKLIEEFKARQATK